MTFALITGAHGFIGQNLARFLSRQGRTVLGLGHGAWSEFAECGVSAWLNGDIDRANLDTISATHGFPREIFHLAGGSLVGHSFSSPLEDFRRSVETTANLLDWVRDRSPNSAVICASSAAVYGGQHGGPISEQDAVSPESPYGVHKSIAESLARSYGTHFGLRVAIVRLFSVYGPGLRKQLLWDMCSRLGVGESPLVLGGTGTERRDWIHINDALRVFFVAEGIADASCPTLNGGTGRATSVADFARHVTDAWEAPAAKFSGSSRPGDPASLVADISLARSLGFQPAEDLAAGVRDTIRWFREARTLNR